MELPALLDFPLQRQRGLLDDAEDAAQLAVAGGEIGGQAGQARVDPLLRATLSDSHRLAVASASAAHRCVQHQRPAARLPVARVDVGRDLLEVLNGMGVELRQLRECVARGDAQGRRRDRCSARASSRLRLR